MAKAFITGITGFVGAHLARKLMTENYEVIGLAHDYKPHTTLSELGLDDYVTKIYGDVRDSGLMKRILAEYRINSVYHLAAQAIVSVALKDPVTTFDVNCHGTASLLEACKEIGVDSILIASTDKVYGEGLNRKETDPLNAEGVYETSKIAMECVAKSFRNTYKMPVIITRACNIYGEGDLNRRIIPNTMRALKNNEQPIIFINEKSLREYIHVYDVTTAMYLLSKKANKSQGEIYNIGSGQSIGQEELVKKIINLSGKHIEPKYVEKPKSLFEIFQQTINSDKIKKEFDWNPIYTLDEGLKRTWTRWK